MSSDPTLAARLYREHGPAICRYLRRRVGDGELARDLFQETFLQVVAQPQRLAQALSPRAWLFGVARNLSGSALRDRRATVELPDQLPAPTAQADPQLERMREAIAGLPEAQKEALLLRLGDRLSYEEIATVLGVPVGTVRSRLHSALCRLRERLTAGEA